MESRKAAPGAAADPAPEGDPVTGGASAAATRLVVSGWIKPARRGAWATIERLDGKRWTRAADVQIGKGGSYSATVAAGARYRVRYAGMTGPVVARAISR